MDNYIEPNVPVVGVNVGGELRKLTWKIRERGNLKTKIHTNQNKKGQNEIQIQ